MDVKAPGCEVALVSMPWAPPIEPCLGLGILKSCLTRAEISARVFHFATDLLRWLKYETYQYVADAWGLNEFIFTATLDPALGARQKAAVVERVMTYWKAGVLHHNNTYPNAEAVLDLFMTVRHEVVPKFLHDAADRILSSNAKIVGFTCLFDQTIASLALATILKRMDPTLTVVFGGYALEGAPGKEIARAFPCVDYLVIGDGERAIVDLVERIRESRRSAAWHPSPQTCGALALAESVPAQVEAGTASARVIRSPKYDLNDSPAPDYDDWYDDLALLEASHAIKVKTEVLPVESSRGCWWGQSKHCVFCGIDKETLKYRYKEAGLTLNMLQELRKRYGDVTFRFSDYIMPKVYYSELLPRLAVHEPRFRLHTEIKANHPPERVRLLADAGFIAIQPGIESFSTPVLRSMDKGVRGIDNVCLLKAGYVERINVYYNILYGLPDDTTGVYQTILQMIPRIYHLMPPVARTETVVTRFAPLQTDPLRFGLSTKAVHHECYDVLFSERFLEQTGFTLDDYAYYFKRNFPYSEELCTDYSHLISQIDHWKMQHRVRFVELSYESSDDDEVAITDSRYSSSADTYTLSRPASLLYKRVDHRPVKFARVREELTAIGLLTSEESDAALAELDERRLVWREDDLLFGLATPKAVVEAHRERSWPQRWQSIFV